MAWERPDLIEIGMNAEIGAYQSDFGDGEPAGPRGPVLDTRPVAAESSSAAPARS